MKNRIDFSNFTSKDREHLSLTLHGKLGIFFGAGVSKCAGFRLWKELVNSMVDSYYLRRDNYIEIKNNFSFSTREVLKSKVTEKEALDYLKNLNRDIFENEILKLFSEDGMKTNKRIYHELNKFNDGKKFFITTNIDRGFQDFLGIMDTNVSISPDFDNNSLQFINYLHGRIDKPNTWVLTTDKYIEVYMHENSCNSKFLDYIFNNFNILFIEYSLNEMEILQQQVKTIKRNRHYWLERYYNLNKEMLKIRGNSLERNYNIKLIPYSIEYEDETALIETIVELTKFLK